MTLMDKACYERGCAQYDYRDKSDTVKVARVEDIRNDTLEEVAREFEKMKVFEADQKNPDGLDKGDPNQLNLFHD